MNDVPNETTERRLRVSVDGDRCIGSGQCELLEAELFRIDDDTAVAAVLGDGLLAEGRAVEVADRCPSGAVIVSSS